MWLYIILGFGPGPGLGPGPGPDPGPWSVPTVAGFLVGVHLVLGELGDLKQMLVGNWEGG
jgi:hypothetical protein